MNRRANVGWQSLAIVSLVAFGWRNMDLLGDAFWYIATGRYVLEHRAFPPDELFAYTAVRGPWFVNMPLAEPLFAWVADHLGVRALLAMCTAFLGGALALLWLPHSKGGVARCITWPLLVLTIFVQRHDLSVRSQTLSDLAIAGVLLCMFRLRDGRRVPRWLPVALGALWINIHPSVLIGVLVPLAFAAALVLGPKEVRSRAAPVALFGALVAAGMFINPYGHRLILEILRFLTAESTTAIDLFRSPDFRAPEILVALALAIGLAFGCLRASSERVGVPEALLLFAAITATCISRRYETFLMACEIVIAGRMLSDLPFARADPSPRWLAPLAVLPIALSVYSWSEKKDPWQNMPVEATRFIEDNHLPDNLLNLLHWGGYLDYAWGGGRRIFIDGRTTQFENGVLTDHGKLWNLLPGWREALDVYLINTILWEAGSRLDAALSQDPAWVAVYRKGIAVVYVRKIPMR